jgi:hypothetical protein
MVEPPTFVAVTNHPDDIHFSYKRYVAEPDPQALRFEGTPVRVLYRKQERDKAPEHPSKPRRTRPARPKSRATSRWAWGVELDVVFDG